MPRVFMLVAMLAAAMFCAAALTAGEEKAGGGSGPKDPMPPSADLRGKEGERQSWVRASLVRARGDRLEGELSVSFPSLNLSVEGTGGAKNRTVTLVEITAIEFTLWQGRMRRKNEYAFYPVRMRVTLADRSVIETGMNTLEFHRLRLRTGERTRTYYTYFFDYREKDAWKNSGMKDMKYPETNPLGDTVVKIIFIHESEAGPLDLFIKGLKK
jgi:hypothetical protein